MPVLFITPPFYSSLQLVFQKKKKKSFCTFVWVKLQCWMHEHSKVTKCYPSGCSISPDVGRIVNINTVYLKYFKIFTSYEIWVSCSKLLCSRFDPQLVVSEGSSGLTLCTGLHKPNNCGVTALYDFWLAQTTNYLCVCVCVCVCFGVQYCS